MYRQYQCPGCGELLGVMINYEEDADGPFSFTLRSGYHRNAGGVYVRSSRPPRRPAGQNFPPGLVSTMRNVMAIAETKLSDESLDENGHDSALSILSDGQRMLTLADNRFSKSDGFWEEVVPNGLPLVVRCCGSNCGEYLTLLQ